MPNVTVALDAVASLREEWKSKPLFLGKSCVVFAGSEFTGSGLRLTGAKLAALTEGRGDAYLFGTKLFADRLIIAAGPGAPVTLVRSRRSAASHLMEAVGLYTGRLANLDLQKATHSIPPLEKEIADALRLERARFKLVVDRMGHDYYRAKGTLDEDELFRCHVSIGVNGSATVTPVTFSSHPKVTPILSNHSEISPAEAYKTLTETIVSMPPGPNGFCLFITCHAFPNALVSGVGANPTEAVLGSEKLAAHSIATALIERSKRYPGAPITVWSTTCFPRELQKQVIAQTRPAGVPIIFLGGSEAFQFTNFDQAHAFPTEMFRTLFGVPAPSRLGTPEGSPTSGDFFRLQLRDPYNNPFMVVPTLGEDGALKQIQISSLDGRFEAV